MGDYLIIEFEGTPKTLVKINNLGTKTTVSTATRKAEEFLRALKVATPNRAIQIHSDMWTLASEIHAAGSKLKDTARNKFLFLIAKAFGGLSLTSGISRGRIADYVFGLDTVDRSVTSVEEMSSIRWINGAANLPKPWNTWWGEPQASVLIVPLCKPWVNNGFLYTFTMQAMIEKGSSAGSESYADVYVSSEIGAKFPITNKIVTVDFRAGLKKGRKDYKKFETKNAIRTGPQVSQSYILQSVGRNCTYFGEKVGASSINVQNGYQIIPREGGEKIGPIWNHINLDGTEDVNSALNSATGKLNELIDTAAVDVAKHFAAMG
jgi:hypothetical protein